MLLIDLQGIWYLEAVEQRDGRPPNLKPEVILAWLDVVAQTAAANYQRATQPAGMSDPSPAPVPPVAPIPPHEDAPPSPRIDPGATIGTPDGSQVDPEPASDPEGILIY